MKRITSFIKDMLYRLKGSNNSLPIEIKEIKEDKDKHIWFTWEEKKEETKKKEEMKEKENKGEKHSVHDKSKHSVHDKSKKVKEREGKIKEKETTSKTKQGVIKLKVYNKKGNSSDTCYMFKDILIEKSGVKDFVYDILNWVTNDLKDTGIYVLSKNIKYIGKCSNGEQGAYKIVVDIKFDKAFTDEMADRYKKVYGMYLFKSRLYWEIIVPEIK